MYSAKKTFWLRQDGAVTRERFSVREIAARFPERQKEAGTAVWTAWFAPLPQGAVALILERTGRSEAIVYTFSDTADGQEWLCRALTVLRRKADSETLRQLRQLLDGPESWEPIVPVVPVVPIWPRPPRIRPIPEPRYEILPVPPVIWVPEPRRREED